MEYVVGQDEVSAKPATLERKDIQSTKPLLVWQLPHTFDHTCGQALYALHRRCLVVGKAKMPAGYTPGLASPEPNTGVGRSLVSRLQNHEAGTEYAGRDLLLVESEEMF